MIISKTSKIFIDGSSPFEKYYPSAYAIFLEKKLIYSKVLDKNLPAQDVEYLALIESLNLIKNEVIKAKKFKIFTDCGFMLQELQGKRTPVNLKLFYEAKALISELDNIKIYQVSRSRNLAGQYLENRLIKLRNERDYISCPKLNPGLKREMKRRRYS